MRKINGKNERVKREYFDYLLHADAKSPATIDGVRKSLLRFEEFTSFKDFATFRREQAISFKERFSKQKAERSGDTISKGTLHSTLNHLKALFFVWLAGRDGYKAKIHMQDIAYFKLSEKETRIAKTPKFKDVPTIEQIRHVIMSMPVTDDITMRNRALVAFTILTGMRDSAIVSLRLKHIDLTQRLVKQDPAEVNTKFSKRIDTFFFPVGDDIMQIVIDWVNYLVKDKLYGFDASVFPRTRRGQMIGGEFQSDGIEPVGWQTARQVREIFRAAFTAAGLPYYNPHSFRNTLVQLAQRYCQTPEEFKAWSQNLGHEHVLTTFNSYGRIEPYRQGQIIQGMTLTDSSVLEKRENTDNTALKKLLKLAADSL